MKKFNPFMILTLSFCLIFSACNLSTQTSSETAYSTEAPSTVESDQQIIETPESSPEPLYFESDSIVDKFFSEYNAIAEIKIPAEEIEKGNIRTKALVYIDDLSLEVINANRFLAVSMSSSVENESTTLYALFRDSIKTMEPNTTDEDIQSAWDSIHESGNLVEDYMFKDINITYIPSKELSWGTSNLRVDLEFPLN